MHRRYRGSQLIRAGFIGVVLIILIIAVGPAAGTVAAMRHRHQYQALFTEAGGLSSATT